MDLGDAIKPGVPCGDCRIFVLTILVLPARFAIAMGTCSFWYTASKAFRSLGCGYATISFVLVILILLFLRRRSAPSYSHREIIWCFG
jgi:hypothetical protein